jgi:hypothetical protein
VREVKEGQKRLGEFFDEFIERHRTGDGEEFELLVTDEDCMALGEFFIKGMVGWASACDQAPDLRSRLSSSPFAGIMEVASRPEESASDEENVEEKSFVH